jgi:hypothetical protein
LLRLKTLQYAEHSRLNGAQGNIRGGEVLKHGKKPTRAQKIRIKFKGLNPDNWLVVKDCPQCFEVVHRVSGKTREWKPDK